MASTSPRYFVKSRHGTVIANTKVDGYKSYRGATAARNRIDSHDKCYGQDFMPMMIHKTD